MAFLRPFLWRLGSGEYSRVWVCTNGFLAFDNSDSTSANPSDIPNSASPNAIIAALWTDLDVDSQASIITGQYVFLSRYYFVIMWKNVRHKASNQRLTFAVILQEAPKMNPENTRYSQSKIWISYNGVSSINTDFTVGIEDHQGEKGNGGIESGSSLGSYNGHSLYFYQYSNSYFVKKLTLHFQDLEANTQFNIWEDDGSYLRGLNLQRNWEQPSNPDTTYMFTLAFAGTATLLYSALTFTGGWIPAACILIDTVLVAYDWGEALLAYNQYSGKQIEVFDREDSSGNQASAEAFSYEYYVDATLSILVDWILDTPNDSGDHSLTITAELEYYEYSIVTGEIIEKDPIVTSVNLNVGPDNNNSFATADTKSSGWHYRFFIGGYDTNDYYKFEVDSGYNIDVFLELTSESKADVEIYLYDPGQVEKSKETLTGPPYYASLSYNTDSAGYWFFRVKLLGDYGFYSFRITLTQNENLLQLSTTIGGTTDPPPDTYTYPTPTYVEVTALADTHYHFDCWRINMEPVSSENPYNVYVDGAVWLRADFEPNDYDITVTTTLGGTTTPPPDVYARPYGTYFEVTAVHEQFYEFDCWWLDGSPVSSELTYGFNVDGVHWLHANFRAIEYELQIEAAEGGSTDPAAGVYSYSGGSYVEVMADPDPFYEFDYWLCDGQNVGAANPYQVYMDGNHALQPVFVFTGVHDLAVIDVSSEKSVVGQGYLTNVSVTVENQGDILETFNVTLYAAVWVGSIPIATEIDCIFFVTLDPGSSIILEFVWNTTGWYKGNWTMIAQASPVLGETDQTDNVKFGSDVLVTLAGDVDGDCDVDIYDIVTIAGAYGTSEGDPGYIANCDLNNNGEIDIFDVSIAAGNYGQSW